MPDALGFKVTGSVLGPKKAQQVKLLWKPLYVQYALTHGAFVDVHLAIRTSNGAVFSGADKFSQVSLLAPEFVTLILQIGIEKSVTSIMQSVKPEQHASLFRHEFITFQGKQKNERSEMEHALNVS